MSKATSAKAAKGAKGKGKAAPKAGKGQTGRRRGKGRGESGSPHQISVAAHPRAGAQVRRAKGFGGLAGFVIAAYVSIRAGVPADQVGLRAIVAGAAGYLLAWGCSVTIWRQLVLAELRLAAEQAAAQRAAAQEPGTPLGTPSGP